MNGRLSILAVISLLAINLLYAGVSIFTKYASQHDFLSWGYIWALVGAVCVMGVYAVLWQQLLKRIPLSLAYMFKGTSLLFVMLFANWLFNEHISCNNVIGSMMIIVGIVMFAYVPKDKKLK